MANYLYIFSSGHSGSTLLDLLLGNCAGAFSLGEVRHLPEYFADNQLCTCGLPVRECGFWRRVAEVLRETRGVDLLSDPGAFRVSLQPDARGPVEQARLAWRILVGMDRVPWLTRLELRRGRGPASTRRILENAFALYNAVRHVAGCEAVVDSSKSLVSMKWLWLARPEDVRMIHLVRDGRGVLASNLRKGMDPRRAARAWARTNLLAEALLRNAPSSVWLFVRYEDLCRDPAATMQRVAGFAGLPYDEKVLDLSGRTAHNIGGNRLRFEKDLKVRNQETWRQKLSAADLALFERLAGRVNRHFGYND